MPKIDILHLDWPNSERDLNISIPVLVHLKKQFNYTVTSKNIFNGLYYLKKYKPKTLLLSNAIGAEINYIVSKYAYLSGIQVITLTSEGNFEKNHMSSFIWGWNKEHKFYHHLQNIWSERALKLAIDHTPEFESISFVGGGTGFDKYKLLPKYQQSDFHKDYPETKKYKSIVGITTYGLYEHLKNAEYVKEHKIAERHGQNQVEMYQKDFHTLKKAYSQVVSENPETLFILRTHPLSKTIKDTEFEECINLPNVFFSIPGNKDLNTFNNNLSVIDCVALSSLWIAYESTTIMEAWLLEKPTTVFNPTTFDFKREANYKGCTKVSTIEALSKNIKETVSGIENKEFKALEATREQIIKDTIGFADGKNHIRVAQRINKHLTSQKEQIITTENIPSKLMWKHFINFIKQKSKLYQMYNPHVLKVYKQNDKAIFEKYYKDYSESTSIT